MVSESEARPRLLGTTRSSLDALSERLVRLGPVSSLEQMLRLGELVHGVLRAKDGTKSSKASLRRIASHPGVPFKVTTLWRAVSVYEMFLRLPELPGLRKLGISHLRAVIGLEPAEQESLLTLAAREGWTKRQLEREVARLREGRRCRGRRPSSRIALWMRELRRVLERGAEFEGAPETLEDGARSQLVALLSEIEEKSRRLRQTLEAATSSSSG